MVTVTPLPSPLPQKTPSQLRKDTWRASMKERAIRTVMSIWFSPTRSLRGRTQKGYENTATANC